MSATHSNADPFFSLDVEPERDVVRVCPKGEVDLEAYDVVRDCVAELVSLGFTRVVLDLRGVTFLDSTGLRLALELTSSSRSEGWEFALIEGPQAVQRVFDVAGVRSAFAFVEPAHLRRAGSERGWR